MGCGNDFTARFITSISIQHKSDINAKELQHPASEFRNYHSQIGPMNEKAFSAT
jgi:hypothetical protein